MHLHKFWNDSKEDYDEEAMKKTEEASETKTSGRDTKQDLCRMEKIWWSLKEQNLRQWRLDIWQDLHGLICWLNSGTDRTVKGENLRVYIVETLSGYCLEMG